LLQQRVHCKPAWGARMGENAIPKLPGM
jgi:hypothetical protein